MIHTQIEAYECEIKRLNKENKELELRNELLKEIIEKYDNYFKDNNLMHDEIKYLTYGTKEQIKSLEDYKDNVLVIEIPECKFVIYKGGKDNENN